MRWGLQGLGPGTQSFWPQSFITAAVFLFTQLRSGSWLWREVGGKGSDCPADGLGFNLGRPSAAVMRKSLSFRSVVPASHTPSPDGSTRSPPTHIYKTHSDTPRVVGCHRKCEVRKVRPLGLKPCRAPTAISVSPRCPGTSVVCAHACEWISDQVSKNFTPFELFYFSLSKMTLPPLLAC